MNVPFVPTLRPLQRPAANRWACREIDSEPHLEPQPSLAFCGTDKVGGVHSSCNDFAEISMTFSLLELWRTTMLSLSLPQILIFDVLMSWPNVSYLQASSQHQVFGHSGHQQDLTWCSINQHFEKARSQEDRIIISPTSNPATDDRPPTHSSPRQKSPIGLPQSLYRFGSTTIGSWPRLFDHRAFETSIVSQQNPIENTMCEAHPQQTEIWLGNRTMLIKIALYSLHKISNDLCLRG